MKKLFFSLLVAITLLSACKKEDSCKGNGTIVIYANSDTIQYSKKTDATYGAYTDIIYPNAKVELDFIPGKYYFQFAKYRSNNILSSDTFTVKGCDTLSKFF